MLLKERYKIIEKIGEDNLFTIYKCEDQVGERLVAVKLLLPQHATNRIFAERLLIDAKTLIGINHPGMVEVFDCGEENGDYYVVTEYIRGLDLKERIRRSAPFTLSTTVDVGLALCEVLDFAHRRGFVHGDLRPGNIMVTSEGQVKLADFWVGGAVASQQAIRTNALMISMPYMAPEVAEGKPATPVSDVYSLGIILFELLTAKTPFDGDTPFAIALKHAREPIPPMRPLNPGVPKSVEALIVRALQKTPEDRFRSAKSMLNELKSVRDALHLSKPLVWSRVDATKPVSPALETGEERESFEESDPPVLKTIVKSLLIFVSVLAVVVVVLASMYYLAKPPVDIKIPNLIGKSYEEAQRIAGSSNIQLFKTGEEFDEDKNFPAGTIYRMKPGAGRTIKAGKSVDVWVSKGSKYTLAPDISKLTLDEARTRIIDSGLIVGTVTQDFSDTIPTDRVISQNPAPGTQRARGQSVDLVYSLGAKSKEEPTTPSEPGVTTETPDNSDNSSSTNANTSALTRSFNVKFTVPSGPADQTVEIRVQDANGLNIAYSDTKHPGDKIEQAIEATGQKVEISIYIDGKLVKRERK